jgi:hypothetical protein
MVMVLGVSLCFIRVIGFLMFIILIVMAMDRRGKDIEGSAILDLM